MLEVTENPGFGELPPHYAVLAIIALMTSSSLFKPVVEVGRVQLQRMRGKPQLLTQKYRAELGHDFFARKPCSRTGHRRSCGSGDAGVSSSGPDADVGIMAQLMPPDGIEVPRILEELDRGHVDLVERRDIAGLAARKTDRRTDRLEEGLHMWDRRAFGTFRRVRRLGMEKGVQPLDLIRIEDAVGFHEGNGLGMFRVRVILVSAFGPVALGGAVVDDDRGF